MRYSGLQLGGAKISGQVEFDFFGGQSTLSNGVGFDLFRLRLALGRVDWKNFSLVAGQDWSVFAPLNPTSLAGHAIPDFSASGNPWIRSIQIRAEFRYARSDTTRAQFHIAATDPNVGDNPATFATVRTAGIGERGRLPAVDSRLAISDGGMTLGLSGHYSRGKNAASSVLKISRPASIPGESPPTTPSLLVSISISREKPMRGGRSASSARPRVNPSWPLARRANMAWNRAAGGRNCRRTGMRNGRPTSPGASIQ